MTNNLNNQSPNADKVKVFNNEDYSQWVKLKNNYPRFRNYRKNKRESGYEEIYRLRPGFYLRILNLTVHQKSVVELTFAGNHLHVCLKIKGKHSLCSSGGHQISLDACVAALYYFEQDEKLIDTCDDDDYLMIMLVINLDIIGEEPLSFATDSLPEMLRPILESEVAKLEFSYGFGLDILAAATALVERKVNNDHLRIYLESKAIELLCLLFQDLSLLEANIRLKNIAPGDLKVLNLVKQHIDRNLQNVPPIPQLATEFNIAPSRLKTGFKSLFGLPIRAYVHGLRMQHAQELLTRRKLNIDLIASELGYGHTSNFIFAFKSHFGMTPKSYQTQLEAFAITKSLPPKS